MWFFIYFLLITKCYCANDFFNKKISITPHFDKYQWICPGYENLPIQYRNVTVKDTKSGYLLIDYYIDVTKDLSNVNLLIKFDVYRCRNRESPDTCIHLTSFNTDKVCAFFASKTDTWSPSFTCLEPKLKCPLKKQVHKGTNCTLDLDSFKWFPLEKSYWKFIYSILNKDTKEVLCCSLTAGYLRKV